MTPFDLICDLINGYKTYSSVILAVVSGLGMTLTRGYSDDTSDVFQALMLIFAGTAVAGLRHAIHKLEKNS